MGYGMSHALDMELVLDKDAWAFKTSSKCY